MARSDRSSPAGTATGTKIPSRPGSTDAALRNVNLFLDSIVENLPHMIFVKDAEELRFVLFNRAGEELLGYSRDELIGKNDYDFFPKQEADFFTGKDREVLEGRKLVDIPEEPIHTRTKGKRLLHTKKIPILDDTGRPTFLLGISEDITERRSAEQRLRQAERLASIGTLAAGIAHEINNPVGAILLYAQAAERLDPSAKEEMKHALGEIIEQSERCGRIVRSVLQFAKQESTEKWLCDINAAARRARHIVHADAKDRGATLHLDLPDGLPRITANQTEIEQVIVNVLQNALQCQERGVHVKLRTEAYDERVRLVVEDDGPGIAEDRREYVFDPFYTGREHKGGTGLGLSIARGIIESHGGTIEARSETGVGTTVVIELPCEHGEDSEGKPR